jgi:aquaporin Z
MARKLFSEFSGTFLLVLLAVGATVSGLVSAEILAVALAFGLLLMALACAIGLDSGAHMNPAVTLAFWLRKRQGGKVAISYMHAQFLCAAVSAGMLYFLVEVGGVHDHTGAFGANGFGAALTAVHLFGVPLTGT